MNILLLILSALPVIVLGITVYLQDKYEKEPFGKLLKAFLFGALSILPAILLEEALGAFEPAGAVVGGLYDGFVVAGCSEEACKLLLLSWAIWKSREFNEYFDGIVYACFTALGFACFENIAYVFEAGTPADSLTTASVRAIVSVPAHFLFGVVMGYHFSLAKFRRTKRRRHLLLAFLLPMLMHGAFDSLLMIPDSLASSGAGIACTAFYVLFVWFDIKMWKWGLRRIRRLQELSAESTAETEGFAQF